MNLFDIVGPIMVGPSSSHTAGAVKIGEVARRLLMEEVKEASIALHGSFLSTGKGHGTDKAIVAGLLGIAVDNELVPKSFEEAAKRGLKLDIHGADLGDVHENTCHLALKGVSGKTLEMTASSIGAGRINVVSLNGLKTEFSAEKPTIIVNNEDKPGCVTEVAGVLGKKGVNIATMNINRKSRGKDAVMVIECDEEIDKSLLEELSKLDGIISVSYLNA